MLRRAVHVGGALGVGAGGVFALKYQEDEGLQRAVRLYTQLLPVVFHYRLVQFKHNKLPASWSGDQEARSAEWLRLDQKYSGPVVELLKDMKGMYVKYGQIGASLTNQLSKEYTEKLRVLENEVPPQPARVVLETIEQDFGCPASEVFLSFDETPVGSASIGQVHRAVLRADPGRHVAVKVQYPTSNRLFHQDMKTIRTFLEIAAPEQVLILDELERSFEKEFNYEHEAQNLAFFVEKLQRFSNHVKVPRPIRATKRVLVMEYLEGVKMLDGVRAYGQVVAQQLGKTLEQLEKEVEEQVMNRGTASKYQGPNEWQIAAYLAVYKVRDRALNLGVWVANKVLGTDLALFKTTLPPNAPYIMQVLMESHGYELLKLGRFQADPHAGNFMLLDDGKIGFIDMGAVKELDRGERIAACLLYASLYKQDANMLLDMVRVSGYRSKHFDEDVIYKLTRFGFDTFGEDLLEGKNIQTFMDDLYARDPWYEAASNLTMAQFLSIRIRAVGIAMNYPIVCSEWWGPMAIKLLEEEGLPYDTWNQEQMVEFFGPPSISKGSVRTSIFL